MSNKDVVIVGAGIVGICCALSLRERGFNPQLVDRNSPAAGASFGNAGVISPWSCVPQAMPGLLPQLPRWLLDRDGPVALRLSHLPKFLPWAVKFLQAGTLERLPEIGDAMNALNRPNVDLYRQHLHGTSGEALVVDSWYVHVYRDSAGANLDALAWRMRAERGVPLEVVRGDALREIEPALSTEYQSAVIMRGQARALDPGGVGETLFEKARAMGVRYQNTGVNALRAQSGGGWLVDTDSGVIKCDQVVVAAGAWSARLLAPFGFKLPLEAERGYHLVVENPGITINHSVMDTQGKFVASQMRAGVRCAGTAEFAGLDARPDYRRARVFKRLARRLFPDISVETTVEWMGTRPSFPDSLPCIGEVPDHPGLFSAFGHSHYGFGMAPQTGRIVSELVSGERPNVSLDPYRIERFSS